MKSYAKISNDGYVVSIIVSDIEQENAIEISELLGDPPTPWHKYHFESRQWIENKPIEFTDSEIKTKRKQMLIDSDWTQLPNGPLTSEQQQQWAIYRQNLRDIPQQSGYPFNVVWPTPPQ